MTPAEESALSARPKLNDGVALHDHVAALLRELDQRLTQRIKLLDAADRDLTESKFSAVRQEFHAQAEALKLQHTEFLRRLHDLNGEADRLRQIQASYWPREAAESYVKEQASAQAALAKQIVEVRVALEKATAETTKRLEDQIRELRDADKVSGGAKAGSAEVVTRLLAAGSTIVALLAIALASKP